jgi:hypothetical protein
VRHIYPAYVRPYLSRVEATLPSFGFEATFLLTDPFSEELWAQALDGRVLQEQDCPVLEIRLLSRTS